MKYCTLYCFFVDGYFFVYPFLFVWFVLFFEKVQKGLIPTLALGREKE